MIIPKNSSRSQRLTSICWESSRVSYVYWASLWLSLLLRMMSSWMDFFCCMHNVAMHSFCLITLIPFLHQIAAYCTCNLMVWTLCIGVGRKKYWRVGQSWTNICNNFNVLKITFEKKEWSYWYMCTCTGWKYLKIVLLTFGKNIITWEATKWFMTILVQQENKIFL